MPPPTTPRREPAIAISLPLVNMLREANNETRNQAATDIATTALQNNLAPPIRVFCNETGEHVANVVVALGRAVWLWRVD